MKKYLQISEISIPLPTTLDKIKFIGTPVKMFNKYYRVIVFYGE